MAHREESLPPMLGEGDSEQLRKATQSGDTELRPELLDDNTLRDIQKGLDTTRHQVGTVFIGKWEQYGQPE
jgi:hypothetical protein